MRPVTQPSRSALSARLPPAAAVNLLEQQLRDQQKLHAAGRLVGSVAHEFNDMLAVVNGFAELLDGELAPGSAGAAYLAEIRAAIEQSCRLNRQLQAFSRPHVLRMERLDMNGMVTGTEGVLRPLLGGEVALVLALEEGLAQVKADAAQLQQVLINLALNARDAMPTGGTLRIATRNVTLAQRTTHADGFIMPAGRYALLEVGDTGHGMSDGTRTRIFEPFFTTRPGDCSAGLGLSTVFGIVKQLGGYVWAESRVKEGTTLYICLPDAAPAAAAAAAGAAVTHPPIQRVSSLDRRTA